MSQVKIKTEVFRTSTASNSHRTGTSAFKYRDTKDTNKDLR